MEAWAQFCYKMWGDSLVWDQYIMKPKEKNVKGHDILYPHCLKKWGGRVPRVPHLIAPMEYSDLPNIPVAQRCQPGVLRQLQVKGTLSSELGRWLPVFHCKVREGHRSLRIVVCVCSSFPSSTRLQSECDVEQCTLQPVTPVSGTAVSHSYLQSGWSFDCNCG